MRIKYLTFQFRKHHLHFIIMHFNHVLQYNLIFYHLPWITSNSLFDLHAYSYMTHVTHFMFSRIFFEGYFKCLQWKPRKRVTNKLGRAHHHNHLLPCMHLYYSSADTNISSWAEISSQYGKTKEQYKLATNTLNQEQWQEWQVHWDMYTFIVACKAQFDGLPRVKYALCSVWMSRQLVQNCCFLKDLHRHQYRFQFHTHCVS